MGSKDSNTGALGLSRVTAGKRTVLCWSTSEYSRSNFFRKIKLVAYQMLLSILSERRSKHLVQSLGTD